MRHTADCFAHDYDAMCGTGLTACDANADGDGAVNNRDLALLQRYINKWGVELG